MPSQTPPPVTSRSRFSTADFQLSPVSALTSTLTRRAPVTPLSSTLTKPSRKSIKTRDFNSCRIHTYEVPSRKLCRINTYKKQGVGGGKHCLPVPIPSGGGVLPCIRPRVPDHQSQITTNHHLHVPGELPH